MEGFNLGTELEEGTVVGVQAGTDADGMTFNLGEVEENAAFEVLPKGTYDAIVEEFEFTTSASSNLPMIKTVYSITDGEFAERKIYDYCMLAGEGAKYSLPRLKQLIVRVCPDVPVEAFNAQKFAASGVIINRACRLVLNIQTQKKGDYKGEKRNTVKEILAADEAGSFLG